MRRFMIAGMLAGLSLMMVIPAHAVDQSVQVCAGSSSVSNGTWTYTAGVARFQNLLNSGQVKTDTTNCSFFTSYWIDAPGYVVNIGAYPVVGLAASQLALQGSGDFSCANGGNGTLASPPVDLSSKSNVLDSVSGGTYATAVVQWTAVFSGGTGQLTGTLYGIQGDSPPQPVQGTITVDCNDPSGGAAPNNTHTVLTMPHVPHGDAPPLGTDLKNNSDTGCVATAGYTCGFYGNPAAAINGVVSATTGSWSLTHLAPDRTTVVTDRTGHGPGASTFQFQEFVRYWLTVDSDGVGVVAAGSPT